MRLIQYIYYMQNQAFMSGRFNSETFSAPPAKFPRIAGPSTLSFREGSVFAGEEFLQEFTEVDINF